MSVNDGFICSKCGSTFSKSIKFCSKCGNNLTRDEDEQHTKYITKSVIFYLVFIAYIVIYYLVSPDFITLQSELILEGFFALIILTFCVFDLKGMLTLFAIPKIPLWVFAAVLVFPVITAPVVTFFMEVINDFLFEYNIEENLYSKYSSFNNAVFWAFLFTAFVPSVFEELGFRGYLFNQLLNITNPKVTILLTAFLFALMHFSLISILWIFPFGVALGYLRYKYNVIWLGMIVHFIHNGLVLFYDLHHYNDGIIY